MTGTGEGRGGSQRPAQPDLLYVERLWPSAATWLLVPLFGALVAAVTAVFGPVAGVAGGLAGAGATAAALVNASARVEVSTAGGLRAGRARVPARFLDGGVAGRGEQARRLRGQDLDARTHLCLRGWVPGVVLVYLDDPDDPTPAWLISSRHPERLLEAVEVAVGRTTTSTPDGPRATP